MLPTWILWQCASITNYNSNVKQVGNTDLNGTNVNVNFTERESREEEDCCRQSVDPTSWTGGHPSGRWHPTRTRCRSLTRRRRRRHLWRGDWKKDFTMLQKKLFRMKKIVFVLLRFWVNCLWMFISATISISFLFSCFTMLLLMLMWWCWRLGRK